MERHTPGSGDGQKLSDPSLQCYGTEDLLLGN